MVGILNISSTFFICTMSRGSCVQPKLPVFLLPTSSDQWETHLRKASDRIWASSDMWAGVNTADGIISCARHWKWHQLYPTTSHGHSLILFYMVAALEMLKRFHTQMYRCLVTAGTSLNWSVMHDSSVLKKKVALWCLKLHLPLAKLSAWVHSMGVCHCISHPVCQDGSLWLKTMHL